MTAKEFLNQPFDLQRQIRIKEKRIQCYRELACSVSSPGFEEHYSSSRNTRAPFERYLDKINVLEEELIRDYSELEKLKHTVDVAIDGMKYTNVSFKCLIISISLKETFSIFLKIIIVNNKLGINIPIV